MGIAPELLVSFGILTVQCLFCELGKRDRHLHKTTLCDCVVGYITQRKKTWNECGMNLIGLG